MHQSSLGQRYIEQGRAEASERAGSRARARAYEYDQTYNFLSLAQRPLYSAINRELSLTHRAVDSISSFPRATRDFHRALPDPPGASRIAMCVIRYLAVPLNHEARTVYTEITEANIANLVEFSVASGRREADKGRKRRRWRRRNTPR